MDKQKQLKGKPVYMNRVHTKCATEGIALLRAEAIDNIKKYPESMSWPDIPACQFADAIKRHYDAMNEAGDPFAVDPETGLPHIWAIQFNCMVLEMKRRGVEYEVKDL